MVDWPKVFTWALDSIRKTCQVNISLKLVVIYSSQNEMRVSHFQQCLCKFFHTFGFAFLNAMTIFLFNLVFWLHLYPVISCSQVLNLHVLDDDIPELKEYFQVTLVSAITGDGKTGSTPTSGASIDPEKETTYITVKASDHPYGNNYRNSVHTLNFILNLYNYYIVIHIQHSRCRQYVLQIVCCSAM